VPLEGISGRSHRFQAVWALAPETAAVEIRAEDLAGNVTRARLPVSLQEAVRPRGRTRVAWLQPDGLRDAGPLLPGDGVPAGVCARGEPPAPPAAANDPDARGGRGKGETGTAGPVLFLPDLPDEITVFCKDLYVEGRATGPSPVQSLKIGGRELLERPGHDVSFGYLEALQEGENRIRIEAVDSRGRRTVRTLRATWKQPEVLSLSARMRLSVLPLGTGTSGAGILRLLEQDLLAALVRQRRFSVVERERLADVLRELRISEGGLAGRKDALRAGRLVAADGLVMGWARETPADIEVLASLIDVETSEVLLTRDAYGEDKGPPALAALMEGLAHRFRQGLPLVEGTVLRCEEDRLYMDAGQDTGIVPGQKLILFRPGPLERHPVTGFCMGREMEAVADGRVVEVFDEASTARALRTRGGGGRVRPSDLFVTK